MDFDDKRNRDDQQEIIKLLDDKRNNPISEISTVKESLKIIVANMQYNFGKVRDRLHDHTSQINATNMMVQHQMEVVDKVGRETKELKEMVGKIRIREAESYSKYIVGLVGLGGLGTLVVVLQIINLVLGK